MAYRGFRGFKSAAPDGSTLAFHLVDSFADLPPVATQGVGNFAFGILGDDEGKTWQVRKLASGLEWHEVGGGIPAGDVTVTGNLQVDGGATVDGDTLVGTLSVSSGNMTLKPGANRAQFSLATFTGPHDFVWPDVSGTVAVRVGDLLPLTYGWAADTPIPTINRQTGTVAVSPGSASITVSNALVGPSSVITANLRAAPTNPVVVSHIVSGSGSFTIYLTGDPGGAGVPVSFNVSN